jgi:hypothetical protein
MSTPPRFERTWAGLLQNIVAVIAGIGKRIAADCRRSKSVIIKRNEIDQRLSAFISGKNSALISGKKKWRTLYSSEGAIQHMEQG